MRATDYAYLVWCTIRPDTGAVTLSSRGLGSYIDEVRCTIGAVSGVWAALVQALASESEDVQQRAATLMSNLANGTGACRRCARLAGIAVH